MVKVKNNKIKTYILSAITLIWLAVSMILLYIKSRTGYRILIDFFGLIKARRCPIYSFTDDCSLAYLFSKAILEEIF